MVYNWSAISNAVAILVAPGVALWIQRRTDREKAKAGRRQEIFKALWVNRKRDFYVARVDALNMIDIEFFDEKPIRDAWEDLFAEYKTVVKGDAESNQIVKQREAKYVTLLYEISRTLGYNFNKTYIRDNYYRPELHNQYEFYDIETKKMVYQLLNTDALPVRFVTSPEAPAVPPAPVPHEVPKD